MTAQSSSFGRSFAVVVTVGFGAGLVAGLAGLWAFSALSAGPVLPVAAAAGPSTDDAGPGGEEDRPGVRLVRLSTPDGPGPNETGKTADLRLRPGGGAHWQPPETFETAALLHVVPQAPVAEPDTVATPVRVAREVTVRRGDTLLDILLAAGISSAEAHEAITELRGVYDPRRLRPGQYLALELERLRAGGGELRLAGLSLDVDVDKAIELSRDGDGSFIARPVERDLVTEPQLASGVIDDSLYAAARRLGVPDETLAVAIRMLSWDVDFQRDIQPGDRFELLYEHLATADGRSSRGGDLLYVGLEVNGSPIVAYRFEHSDGRVGYYDPKGRSVRKSLLRTPVDGARLSSRFGKRRHPILGYTRMHKGVDFAAPPGTPIYAAGDGTVVMAGRNGGYGNYVRIRHNGEYATAYAHMSRIARGIRKGRRVEQGQVIGYVGSTGRSTGPHLHYEILKAGRQVNPLAIAGTVAHELRGEERAAFRREMARIDRLREELRAGQLVASRQTR